MYAMSGLCYWVAESVSGVGHTVGSRSRLTVKIIYYLPRRALNPPPPNLQNVSVYGTKTAPVSITDTCGLLVNIRDGPCLIFEPGLPRG